ncbi:hypothetical protein EPO15_02905 [bacterium]|nr:MAG: hypothetical protein EPO15_02905 [bacterium]
MSLVLANAGRTALLALFAFTALGLRREALERERAAVLAVEASDVRALCARAGCREAVFYERLKHLGVSGVVLRSEPLERLVDSKEVLRFSASELARMKEAGLAASAAPLAPGALFVRDEGTRRRLEEAALAQDAALRQGRWGKMAVLELPGESSADGFSAGFDPASARAAAQAGLTAVYRAATTADLRLAVDADGPAAVLLDRDPSAFQAAARGALEDALAERRLWAALPSGAAASGLARGTGRLLAAGEMPASAPLSRLLSVVEGEGTALVVLRLEPALDPAASAAGLRRLARGVRSRGVGTAWPVGQDDRRRPGSAERAARAALAVAACVLGAVWGMRRAVAAARTVSTEAWLAEAAPLREAAVGCAAAALCAAAAGAVSHAAMAEAGPGAPSWSGAAVGLVGALGFAGLWLSDAGDWKALRGGDRGLWLRVGAAAALVWFLASPPAAAGASLSWLSALRPGWWWMPGRWQEILVGWPALLIGLCVYTDSDADARPWLFAGLAGPAGAVLALSRARVPYVPLLSQSAQAAALGLLFGSALWAAWSARRPSAR